MNEFDTKYIKISSKYLQDKINFLKVKKKDIPSIDVKGESSIKKFINSFFKFSSK